MKYLMTESALKASSLIKSQLLPTAVSCGLGDVQVSRVNFMKLNSLQICKVKCLKNDDREIKGQYQGRKTKFVANAICELSESEHVSNVLRQRDRKSFGGTWEVIYKYSRAYTLKGTVLSIISISLLAVQNLSDFTPSFFLGVLQAIVGGCLANLYVVGINQLSDIDIDKVNKPYLPLASGELPVTTAILLTSLYALLGFCLGWSVKSWPLKLGLFLWYAFGTAYSIHIPLLRWKSVPVLAAMCLWSVQGLIVPILFHLHAQVCIQGRTLLVSKHAFFVSVIMSVYGVVIALFKDIPDVEGDKINGINSFAAQFGQKQVFWICIWLLEMVYGMAIVIGLSSPHFGIRSIMVIGHSILAFILWRNANLVDLKNNEAIESFYLFIWKLYYVEYLLVPMLRY